MALAGVGFAIRRRAPARLPRQSAVLRAGGWTVLAAFGAIVIWYAGHATYMDPAEPTIPAVAAVFSAGKPLYPALDAPERYAHIYGPDLFIVHAAAMALFGQSIVVSKAVGPLAIVASLVLAYRLFAARAGSFVGLIAVAICALIFLDFGNASFWTRPDPLLVFSVMLGLEACRTSGSLRTLIVLGVATGIAVNLKASGPVYLLPVYVLAGVSHGPRVVAGAAAVAALTAAAPFLLTNVSFTHYLQYLELSARNGLVASKLRQNVEWAAFLLGPLAAVTYVGRRVFAGPSRDAAFVVGVGSSVLAIAVLAAKPGAGPYHFLPCALLVAYAVVCCPARVWDRRWVRSLVAAVALTAVVIAVLRQSVFLRTVIDRDLGAVASDLRAFADAHPASRIGVGYAGTAYFSHARPEIVFRTRDYLLDAPAIQEHRLSGLELPDSTLQAIASCRMEYWLIPKGGDAFDVPSAYWPDGPPTVFPEAFRRSFFAHYTLTGGTRFFTVWQCRRDAATGSPGDVAGFGTPES